MKILMLTPYLPYPLYSGGQTRSFNLIKNLSKNHRITLFSFIRSEQERSYIKYLKPYCDKVLVFKRRSAWSLINIMLAIITPFPFLVVIYLSLKLRKALVSELKKRRYDLIHAETFYVMPNIPPTKIPMLLVEQTVEYRVYQHFMEQFGIKILKIAVIIDVLKVKFWETFYWQKARKVVAVSLEDRNTMKDLVKSLDPGVVPNGVDPKSFNLAKTPKFRVDKPTILYVGNFKWLQNREAVEILVNEIWPIIKQQVPEGRLRIVGRNVSSLKNQYFEGVIFDGQVENIQDVYHEAYVVLAPIAGPGGTRLKVLEAMASGCPVITTPVGIQGIEARNNKEVLIGKTNRELAQLTIKIINNPKIREELIASSRRFVVSRYNWQNITLKLENIYKEVIDGNQ